MVQDTPVTDRDFAALFREEAGSILTEQQINDEIEREQTRSAQAARAGIAPNRFRGFNLCRSYYVNTICHPRHLHRNTILRPYVQPQRFYALA